MKDHRKPLKSPKRAAGLVGLAACLMAGWAGTADAQVLPPNPDPTCVVPPSDFNKWFASGTPSLNGLVNPADSLNLDTSNNCNFYKWSVQMFLWLTSPASGIYQGGRVFDTQVFYQLNGSTLVAQNIFGPRNFAVRTAQAGANGLPVVVDAAGNLREFVTAPSQAGVTALTAAGQLPAELATFGTGSDGKAVLRSATGNILTVTPQVTVEMLPQTLGRLEGLIPPPPPAGGAALSAADPRQQIADALTAAKVLIKFDSGGGSVFVEAGTGIVTNLGPGQAGGNGVLVSQQNSVIFYETLVNDVYAWYLTGRKTPGGIAPLYNPKDSTTFGLFPTAPPDLQAIENFSKTHGGPPSFPDGNALAIEVKLSWVDARTLPNNAQGYIITLASVPTYNTSNPRDWVPSGSQVLPVALVGAHVVGSTKGHPEMVWATFEHAANAPLATYQYKSGGNTVTVQQNTTGTWLFSASGAPAPYNVELAVYCPPTTKPQTPCTTSVANHIVAATTASILPPGNILRQKSWGVATNGVPNQEDKTPADSNTEVISLDTNIQAQLKAAGASSDPRYNYLMIGSTWTFGGNQPTGPYPKNTPPISNPPKYNEIGTSMLFNSSMETFQQGPDTTWQTGNNCFACHSNYPSFDPTVKANTSVSHIFGSTNPLPTQ
jgi:hypothetical protein